MDAGGRLSGGQTIGGNWTKNPDSAINNAKVLAGPAVQCFKIANHRYPPASILSLNWLAW